MYLLLLIFPLFASISAGFCGRYLGFRGAALITTSSMFLSFCCSALTYYEVAFSNSPCFLELSPWFFSEMVDAQYALYFDTLTVVMLLVVTSISLAVHVYSIGYMYDDPHLPRFMSYLSLFTFFMLILVTSSNFLQLFLGWEGVGLCSYLLINFWYTRLQASKASLKAMLVNRIGDFGLALGIFQIFCVFKTVDFAVIFACVPEFSEKVVSFWGFECHALSLICILLSIGAIGKSAQLGLHTWLPDAMEGPTPVSALIHAATMVTAGVFLINRCSILFEYSEIALLLLTFCGAMTCFFAATTGVVQNDMKKVIAYSTCSQLGYMFFICGLSHYHIAIFHLVNHAFFKALLFLSAGSVIHALANLQDLRKMGALVKILPLTYSVMLIGSFSIVGFPFLTGFYSKDSILEVAYAGYTLSASFAYFLGAFCVLLTSYYSFRIIFLTFLSFSAASRKSLSQAHDSGLLMAFPLILLSLCSIFVGYLLKDMMIGLGSLFWGNSLFIMPHHLQLLESEYIPQYIKFLPFVFTLFGAFLAYYISIPSSKQKYQVPSTSIGKENYTFAENKTTLTSFQNFKYSLYVFLNKRWFFDTVYHDYLAFPLLVFAYQSPFKTLDKGVFEIFGPYGITTLLKSIYKAVSRFQTGKLSNYAVVMLLGLTFFLSIAALSSIFSDILDQRLYFVSLCSFFLYTQYIHLDFFRD